MRFRMLGPLRVLDPAGWAPIQAPQQRVVLAILLLEHGRPVTTDRLIDEIWSGDPPRAAVATVQGYVMRLRRRLGAPETLLTRGGGYELHLDPDDLDTAVFERLVESARLRLAAGDAAAGVAHLSDALELWNGPALADVPPNATVSAHAARLEQARVAALRTRLRARLDLGQAAVVVDEAQPLVRAHPLDEQLVELFMMALHRSGRRAEALDEYQRARRCLIEEIGLEPGQALQEVQRAILQGDVRASDERGGGGGEAEPTTADAPRPQPAEPAVSARSAGPAPEPVVEEDDKTPVPAQLPSDVADFVGRDDELAELERLGAPGPRDRPAVVTITGAAGVGKTALAVRWARRVAHGFRHGQLYVDLHGYAAGSPRRPVEVLGRFLRALGVEAAGVPTDEDEAAALYRSRLAGRDVLVVLDNAHDADQIRPLLPGGPGCVVVVTSRDQLGGLIAREGAARLKLDVLTPTDAHALLARVLGPGPSREDLADLASLCGYLPLALRIAAANLVLTDGLTVAAYAARLTGDDRLGALSIDGDPQAAVRAALHHSYATLPAEAQHLFRLLGLVPGPHVTAPAAAAAANLPRTHAARWLDLIASAHLIDEHTTGRYSFHDLVRRFAADQAAISESRPSRRAALDRLFDYYLRAVAAAADHVSPQITRAPLPAGPARPPVAEFRDHADASVWLDAERANLVAAVSYAAEHGPPAAAWRLADALRGYLYSRMYTVDWLTVAEAGLVAAGADGDPRARAAAHVGLASVHWATGRHREALDHFTAALPLARAAGWSEGESGILGNLGNLSWALGRLDQAATYYGQALALYRRNGQAALEATALSNLGLVLFGQGRLADSAEQLTGALDVHRRVESRSGEARTLTHLGDTYLALGRTGDARAALTSALHVLDAIGDRNIEGDTIRSLAAVCRDEGRHDEAVTLATRALEMARDTGYLRLEAGARITLATVETQLGHHERAIAGHRHGVRLARDLANRYFEAEALVGLADALAAAGRPGEAAEPARAALAIAREDGYGLLADRARAILTTVDASTVG
jgi:DNA-binding SARP family transcriptional activator/Tfp pilus assembly protein PilF